MAIGLWNSNGTNGVSQYSLLRVHDDGGFFSSIVFRQSLLSWMILIHSAFIIQNNNNKWMSDNHLSVLGLLIFPSVNGDALNDFIVIVIAVALVAHLIDSPF